MTETKARRRAGRPRVFDTDAALDKAVRLFWQRGYEATSMADLVAETGVAAASLYGAFDNKAGLFAAVIERYAATSGRDLSDLDFYVAFGYWKLACILEGVYARYVGGALGERDHAELEPFRQQVDRAAEMAAETLERLR